VPECRSDSFALVTEWMLENLDQDLTVDQLARRALMSSRTFARRFRSETGTTPAAWLNRQRILRAQQELEQTDDGLEQIAQRSGFGTAAVMRHHFLKVLQTTPTAYRRTFGARAAGCGLGYPTGTATVPACYHSDMSIQVAVRLSDELASYVDGEVAAGRAPSRAAVLARALERERRERIALADIQILRFGVDDDLDGAVAHAARLPLDLA
jgi:AraC-like DNA-binding protein